MINFPEVSIVSFNSSEKLQQFFQLWLLLTFIIILPCLIQN